MEADGLYGDVMQTDNRMTLPVANGFSSIHVMIFVCDHKVQSKNHEAGDSRCIILR